MASCLSNRPRPKMGGGYYSASRPGKTALRASARSKSKRIGCRPFAAHLLSNGRMTTSRTKHSPAAVLPVTILAPGKHMRRPSLPPASTVLGQWAHSLQVAGRMATVSEGQGQPEHDAALPTLQGHALGLGGQVGIRRAMRPAKSAKMGACGVHTDQGHKQAVIITAHGHGKLLHDSLVRDS